GLITVESDKASMEVPSSHSGVVKEVRVKLGDKVNQGNDIVILEVAAASGSEVGAEAPQADVAPAPVEALREPDIAPESNTRGATPAAAAAAAPTAPVVSGSDGQLASAPPERHSPTEAFASADVPMRNLPHASPSVRKFARELGVDLTRVQGSGAKNRITHDDVRTFVKQALAQGATPAATANAAVSGEGGL